MIRAARDALEKGTHHVGYALADKFLVHVQFLLGLGRNAFTYRVRFCKADQGQHDRRTGQGEDHIKIKRRQGRHGQPAFVFAEDGNARLMQFQEVNEQGRNDQSHQGTRKIGLEFFNAVNNTQGQQADCQGRPVQAGEGLDNGYQLGKHVLVAFDLDAEQVRQLGGYNDQ